MFLFHKKKKEKKNNNFSVLDNELISLSRIINTDQIQVNTDHTLKISAQQGPYLF